MAKTAKSENKSKNLNLTARTSLNSIILVLYGRLKDQSKNNLAVIKKSESQAAHTSKENKLLADKNEKYAHYLNCVITAMNNSMSIKVSFIRHHRHLVMLVTKWANIENSSPT